MTSDFKRVVRLSVNVYDGNARKHYVNAKPCLVAHIEIPSGRRPVNPDVVDALAESIKTVGLMNPIRTRHVDGMQTLVAGLHRLEAYKKLGLPVIPAVTVDATDDEAAIAEIDENLYRAELSDAEIADVISRRKAIYERLHPETKQGGDRQSEEAKSKRQNVVLTDGAPTFTEDTAAKTGKDKRTIERAARRGRELGPETLERIKGTSLDKAVELDALAKLPPEERAPIVDAAEAGEKVSARKEASPEDTEIDPADLMAIMVDSINMLLRQKARYLSKQQVREICDRVATRWRPSPLGANPPSEAYQRAATMGPRRVH